MKDSIIKQCLTILKKDEVKKEIVEIITPFTEPILEQLYPYIYISLKQVAIETLWLGLENYNGEIERSTLKHSTQKSMDNPN